MKKRMFSLSIVLGLPIISYGMQKKEPVFLQAPTTIPKDLLYPIIQFVAGASTLKEAYNQVISLLKVNRAWYRMLSDENFIRFFVDYLYDTFIPRQIDPKTKPSELLPVLDNAVLLAKSLDDIYAHRRLVQWLDSFAVPDKMRLLHLYTAKKARENKFETISFVMSLFGPSIANPVIRQAISKGDLSLIQRLVAAGADVTGRAWIAESPLVNAINAGSDDIVRYLGDHDALLDWKDPQTGNTPLMYAVRKNNEAMVKYLMNKGADWRIANDAGDTAWDIANIHGYTNIADYIADYTKAID